MDPFARAEQRRPPQATPRGWDTLRREYYQSKARWQDRVWDSPQGRSLAADIRAMLAQGPLERGESALFATPQTIALYWDIVNECEVGARNILVVGERGTGKEELAGVIARELGKEKVTINCAMLVESLADAQLFGVEGNQGIANVPKQGSEGIVQKARGRVLFLDELFDAPSLIFPKLLRLLQQRTFSRVGGTEEEVEDTVIVAASNRYPTRRALDAACANGTARGDMVDRFSSVLEIPPLRERREEIPFLANHILMRFWQEQPAGRRHFPFKELSREASQSLRALDHSWPGNLRELGRLLREQGMLRRHESRDEHVLHIPYEALELWLGSQRPSEAVASEPVSLTAWTRAGLRQLREAQLLALLREAASSRGLSPAQIDSRWVAETCRIALKKKNVLQTLKDSIGKNASQLAELLRAM